MLLLQDVQSTKLSQQVDQWFWPLFFPAISIIRVGDRTGNGIMTLESASISLYLIDWPYVRVK